MLPIGNAGSLHLSHVTTDNRGVIYFFRRGIERRSCETRLRVDGVGYELVVSQDGKEQVERFATLPDMLSREHEFLQAWRAQGWRDADAPRHR